MESGDHRAFDVHSPCEARISRRRRGVAVSSTCAVAVALLGGCSTAPKGDELTERGGLAAGGSSRMPEPAGRQGDSPVVADATRPADGAMGDAELARLAEMMTGTFDSADQASTDEAFFPIRLVMLPVDVVPATGDWLYVEQALASTPDEPYRQRVYHLRRIDAATIASDVYTLAGDPSDFVEAWRQPGGIPELDRRDLVLRDGCSIELRPSGPGSFAGSTQGEGCSSSLGDAAYATSEVEVRDGMISSWDRGWTETGEQAWGAVSGPYVFIRRSPGAPPVASRD